MPNAKLLYDVPNKTIRKQTRKWKMKNGEKIRICDMEDRHLANTLRLLYRYGQVMQLTPPPHFQGEMAQLIADQEWDKLQHSHPLEIAAEAVGIEVVDALVDDAHRRGIDIDAAIKS